MVIATSKLTAQGQVSVPSSVRKKLALAPGSILEWEEQGGRILVRRAGRYDNQDLHQALFRRPPRPRSLEDLKEGPRRHARRHARH